MAGGLLVAGWRRQDPPRATCLLVGLLTGGSLTVCPVTHHYYFRLLLPLLMALVDRWLAAPEGGGERWRLGATLLGSLAVDVAGRLPCDFSEPIPR